MTRRVRVRRITMPRWRFETVAYITVALVAVAAIFSSAFLLLVVVCIVSAAMFGPREYLLDKMKFHLAYGLEGWLKSGEANFGDAHHHRGWFGGTEVLASQTRLPQSWRVKLDARWALLWGACIRYLMFRRLPWQIVREVTLTVSYRAQPYKKEQDYLDDVAAQVAFIIGCPPELLHRDEDLLAARLTYRPLDTLPAGVGPLAEEVNGG